MALETREFFRDDSGATWRLARETVTGHVFVRHEAQHVSHMEIAAFLQLANQRPEHRALRDLIGGLVPSSEPGR